MPHHPHILLSRHVPLRCNIVAATFVTLLLLPSCSNNFVPKADYDALLSQYSALQAENDSLHFLISDLQLHNDYLQQQLLDNE